MKSEITELPHPDRAELRLADVLFALSDPDRLDIVRQLAAWAAILAVPTAIAGIYGMNFANMPELQWQYGYFAVLGVVAGLCGYLYWRFRRSGWL